MNAYLWLSLGLMGGLTALGGMRWVWLKACEFDRIEADKERMAAWTLADELREDDALAKAIADWKESLEPMTPEQQERGWQVISAAMATYPAPRRRRFAIRSTRGKA